MGSSGNTREFAFTVLMDLSSCPTNEVAMTQMDKVLATLTKLTIVEDEVEMHKYVVLRLQNLGSRSRL